MFLLDLNKNNLNEAADIEILLNESFDDIIENNTGLLEAHPSFLMMSDAYYTMLSESLENLSIDDIFKGESESSTLTENTSSDFIKPTQENIDSTKDKLDDLEKPVDNFYSAFSSDFDKKLAEYKAQGKTEKIFDDYRDGKLKLGGKSFNDLLNRMPKKDLKSAAFSNRETTPIVAKMFARIIKDPMNIGNIITQELQIGFTAKNKALEGVSSSQKTFLIVFTISTMLSTILFLTTGDESVAPVITAVVLAPIIEETGRYFSSSPNEYTYTINLFEYTSYVLDVLFKGGLIAVIQNFIIRTLSSVNLHILNSRVLTNAKTSKGFKAFLGVIAAISIHALFNIAAVFSGAIVVLLFGAAVLGYEAYQFSKVME